MDLQRSPFVSSLITPVAFSCYGDLSMVGELPVAPNLETLFPNGIANRALAACCLSGIWLLHNHLDRSHSISQQVEPAEGSFWHAIMHRMEGDYWNSKYWFRRVGNHDCFAEIVRHMDQDDELEVSGFDFVVAGMWDPMGFVDFCESVDDASGELMMAKQRVAVCEWRALFEYCWSRACA